MGTDVWSETPPGALATYITPNDAFFVRHHWPARAPDAGTWELEIGGEVLRPHRLSLAELRSLPSTTVTCVLECSGNERALYDPKPPGLAWNLGAVGNARWTGVSIRSLFETAGVRPGVRHLHAGGADEPPDGPPFLRSLPIEKALEDAIVAYEMNGEPLPDLHGAPARLVVPGWAGEHWMKWLTRLSAKPEEATGYFQQEDYRYPDETSRMVPVTELFVKARITSIPSRARVGSPVEVRGYAFSGAPDVEKVEVSDDDGAWWATAELDPEHDPYAWRLWSFRWTPKRPGSNRLFVRATDCRGSVQPRDAVWNPGGYLHNAWDSVQVDVAP